MQGKSWKKSLPIVLYSLVLVVLAAAIVVTLGAAFSADFARSLEHFIVYDLGGVDFDLFVMGQYAIVILAIVAVGLLVLGDELSGRKAQKLRR